MCQAQGPRINYFDPWDDVQLLLQLARTYSCTHHHTSHTMHCKCIFTILQLISFMFCLGSVYTRLLAASADKPQQKFWPYTENQG